MTSTPAPGATASAAAPTRKPAAPAGGLIASLVGIRGYLALVVVAVHLAPFASAMMPPTTPYWTAVWHHGYVALDLFFVLSGFVISSGYRRTFARWPGWGTFGKFLWARLSRFYPIHLAVLAVMVAAVLGSRAVGHEIPHGGNLGWDLVRQITLTSGWGGAHALTWNGPVWSLSAEWACYLVLPILLPLVLRLRSTWACVLGYVVACAIPLVAYSFLGFDDATITYEMPLPRAFGAFLAGCALCQLTHVGSRIPAWLGRVTGPLVVLTFAAIAVLAATGRPSMLSLPIAGLVVVALAQERGAVNAFLGHRWSLLGGEYSVALFLVHVPWILAASLVINPRTFPGAWGIVGTLLLLLGSFVLAVLAYRLIERPAQRWMRRIVRRPATAPRRSVDERTDRAVGSSST
ncbi:acyltransferase [Actinomycetospora sp. TBRC 11914]|uniref:acyltransferase family protein n=1 Tax=Actinomycetospora sp. TBRC 11914 TaxID=2729387 RepID=UPI00145EE3E4|nr:acyltransferase [Actinomycetospora sp. TBRC 11914]NMO92528.1 acyltransferase [Actinomycetospora sp. TBRC 11914]